MQIASCPTKPIFDSYGKKIGMVALDGSHRVFTNAGNASIMEFGKPNKNHYKRVAAARDLLISN